MKMQLRMVMSGTVMLGALLATSAQMNAQEFQEMRARITGNPNDPRGKCTIEVRVDIAAEIEIRGDVARMRNFGGQPARWVRFQCNAPMPIVPLGFRFSGVDGRGRQSLLRPPVNGDPAVIRIDDPSGGSEGYTFDVEWNGAGPAPGFGGGNRGGFGGGDRGRDDRDRDDRGRGYGRRMSADEAIRVCDDAVTAQARDRLRVRDISIRKASIDDGPGRRDWVIGTFEAGRGRDRDLYNFQCSMDFEGGRLRSADFQRAR